MEQPMPGGQAAGQPPGRPGSPSGMSKLKASTRKLASKLGIGHHKKDRGRGVDTPTGGGSPRAESPMPASPAAAAIPAAGAGTTPAAVPLSPHSPVAPVTPGLEGPLQTGLEAPLQAASPLLVAGGGTESPRRLGPAEDLESARKRLARLRSVAERAAHLAPSGGAASPRATGSPRTAAQALEVEHRAHAGQAAAHLLGVPSPPVAASLPAAAPATMPGSERAATSAAQPAAGLLAPSAAERAAKPAAPPLASEPVLPAAGQRAAAPAPAHAAMAAASALEQPKQSRHRVEAAALGPEGGAAGTAQAAHPGSASERPTAAPARVASPRTPGTAAALVPAPASTEPAGGVAPHVAAPPAAAEAAAAEEKEQEMSEGLAAYRPATADTRRGRLNILVAQASPYLGPLPGTAGPAEAGSPGAQAGPGAEAGEAEETGAAAPGAWRVAADQPVAAVGGTTGTTHVGGPGELEAARLHRRAAPEAAAEAAAGAAEEGAAGGAPQRPLSPTDARKGQGLAAADVAAGHHAAVDAAAGTAGEAGVSGGAAGRAAAAPEEVQPLLQEEREAEAEARAGPQKPEAAPGEELPGLQQQREAGRAEAGPAVAGTAASAEPGSPASAPSPRPSGLAALQAESALLLEQEAALAPLGEGQEQQQAELEGSAAGPSLAMRKAEEGRPAEQAPSAGAAARVRAQREPGAEPAAEARPSEERAIGMGPALDRLPAAQELAAPLTVGRRRAPSQPLLPAGAFSQAQNVSVFSPHQPEVYEVRDQEVDLATQVLPSGAAATVGPQSELGVQLAPLAAGDEPARLEAGPFGAVEDISVLAPTGALPEEEEGEEEVLPKAPGMDRSTKEEAVDVDELAGRLMPAEREEEAAAEAPLTATATSAAQQAAATAADTGAAAKEAAASTAASAAQAARVTVERVAAMAGAAAGAVADAASRLSTGVSEKAAAAKEAAVDTAGSAAEKAATAKEAASETATQVAGTAAQATTAAKEAATGAAEAAAEKVTAAKDVATTATTIAAGTAAEAAGEGVGAAVDKAATAKQTVAAAAEQVAGATAEKGAAAKEAAAEAASATVERAQGVMAAARGEASRQVDTGRIVVQTSEAAGGRPEAAGPSVQAEIAAAEEGGGPAVEQAAAAAGEEDAVACNEAVSASLLPALEGAAEPAELSAPALPATARAMPTSPGQAAAGGGPAAAVLPVAVHKVDKEPAREAAMRSTAVDASLAVEQEAPEVGEAELAEQEAAAAAQAAGPGRTASPQRRTPTSPGAGRGPVLPVAVTAEDRQLAREAAAHSLAVDASLAAEQDAPEVGDAELEAAAATAQPEGLDATPEYLAERAEARGQSGLGAGSRLARDEEAAAAAGAGAEPAGRLQMKDISGLGGASGLAEQAPSAEGTSSGPASEGTASEPWQEPELSPTERKRAMASQFSIGGLREPPPSPTASASPAGTSSPAGGGPGDVPRPSRLAVAASALPGPVAGAAEGSRDAEPAPAAEGLGIEAEEREAAAAEGLEQAAEGVKAEAAKGLAAEASEGVETLAEAEGGGAAEAPLEGAASGSGAGLAGRALDRIDTAGSSTGETAGPEKDMQRLETGTSMDGSEAGEIEEVVIPAVITPLGRVRHMLRAAMNWVHANPVLAAGGGVVLATVLWAVLVRLAVEVLGEFGPALAMAATLAVVGTAVAWLARYVGLQEGELTMVQDPALAAPATGAGGGAAAAPKERPAAAAAGAAPAEASAPTLGEVEALPSIPGATASEPVSAESTEDLRESGGGGGSGIMQAARHAVVDAAEGAMEAVEPGREQVGEVIQETESGGEEAQEGDVLGSAVRAVTGAAAAAAHKLGALTDRAYQALRKEAPGADVSGEGAPIKSLATAPVVGEEEQRARLEPASFEPAPRPSPLPATSGGGEEPQSGYESDTEEPGPVLEGVHPAHYQPTGGQPGAEPYPPHHHHRHHHHHAGGQVQGTIVAAAEQAGTPHSHITEGTPAEEEPQGASEGPAPAAEAPAGRLGRAAEAASELAATAAGKVKHAAAVATGTAEEQRQPGQQLADLQRSIAAMEEERAGDVRFQQAGKQLGL